MRIITAKLSPYPCRIFALVGACLSLVSHCEAKPLKPGQICDQVARIASKKIGVPLPVLQAITRTETGRNQDGAFGPWPWTVNMEGKGLWFETLDEARAFVFRNFKKGARSFDVGCFQINYKWHHQAFSSIDEMFDPEANAIYAAKFLRTLHQELGDWSEAAGAFHSRTPKFANRYRAIFEKHHKKVLAKSPSKATFANKNQQSETARIRVNNFPLLQHSGGTHLGSLFPSDAATENTRLINFSPNADE